MQLTFEIEGPCVPKGRPRFGRGRTWTPAKTTEFEARVARVAGAIDVKWPPEPAPLELSIDVVYPRPKTRPEWLPKPLWALSVRFAKPTRPDADNLVKSIADGLQRADRGGALAAKGRAGTWMGDDARLQLGRVRRWYGAPGETARTIITLGVVDDFGVV